MTSPQNPGHFMRGSDRPVDDVETRGLQEANEARSGGLPGEEPRDVHEAGGGTVGEQLGGAHTGRYEGSPGKSSRTAGRSRGARARSRPRPVWRVARTRQRGVFAPQPGFHGVKAERLALSLVLVLAVSAGCASESPPPTDSVTAPLPNETVELRVTLHALACDPDGGCAGSQGDDAWADVYAYGEHGAIVPARFRAEWSPTSPATETLRFVIYARLAEGGEVMADLMGKSPLATDIELRGGHSHQLVVKPAGTIGLAAAQEVIVVVEGPVRKE